LKINKEKIRRWKKKSSKTKWKERSKFWNYIWPLLDWNCLKWVNRADFYIKAWKKKSNTSKRMLKRKWKKKSFLVGKKVWWKKGEKNFVWFSRTLFTKIICVKLGGRGVYFFDITRDVRGRVFRGDVNRYWVNFSKFIKNKQKKSKNKVDFNCYLKLLLQKLKKRLNLIDYNLIKERLKVKKNKKLRLFNRKYMRDNWYIYLFFMLLLKKQIFFQMIKNYKIRGLIKKKKRMYEKKW
jgi:hypothetical protein